MCRLAVKRAIACRCADVFTAFGCQALVLLTCRTCLKRLKPAESADAAPVCAALLEQVCH
jgi:hypothetical protein